MPSSRPSTEGLVVEVVRTGVSGIARGEKGLKLAASRIFSARLHIRDRAFASPMPPWP
jgi:hypothetical protein